MTLLQNAVYSAAFISLGLLCGVIGPALPDLKAHIPGADYGSISTLFLARGAGGLSGSIIMGQLLEKASNSHVLLCITTLIACCGACVLPLAPTLVTLAAAAFILDFGLGGVNCAGNTLCAWANASNPTPALSVLNGAFGLGALLAPMALLALGSNVKLAFWAIAALSAACALTFLLVTPPVRQITKEAPPVWLDGEEDDCDEAAAATAPLAAGMHTNSSSSNLSSSSSSSAAALPYVRVSGGVSTLLPLTGLFIALSVGAEVSFGSFVVPYAMGQDAAFDASTGRSGFKITEVEADFLDSCFWATFTAARLIWGVLALRLHPAPSLLYQLTTLFAATTFMVAVPTKLGLWIGAVLFGAGMSGCFAAALAQLQEGTSGMSGAAGAWVSGGASLGSLVQLLVSSQAETPSSILAIIWLACALAVAAMCALWLTNAVRWQGRPGSKSSSSSSGGGSSEAQGVQYKAIALQDMSAAGADSV